MQRFSIRPASLADVPVLAETVHEGFESYREFAPAGWEPPPLDADQGRIEQYLPQPDAWCLLVRQGDDVAGHVALLAAREHTEDRPLIPGLAHLWMLFVRRPWWGTGLAPHLLGLVVAEAGARGFERMRLFTPAGQARARAFYEREGFTTDGVPTLEPMIGLELVEYQRSLA